MANLQTQPVKMVQGGTRVGGYAPMVKPPVPQMQQSQAQMRVAANPMASVPQQTQQPRKLIGQQRQDTGYADKFGNEWAYSTQYREMVPRQALEYQQRQQQQQQMPQPQAPAPSGPNFVGMAEAKGYYRDDEGNRFRQREDGSSEQVPWDWETAQNPSWPFTKNFMNPSATTGAFYSVGPMGLIQGYQQENAEWYKGSGKQFAPKPGTTYTWEKLAQTGMGHLPFDVQERLYRAAPEQWRSKLLNPTGLPQEYVKNRDSYRARSAQNKQKMYADWKNRGGGKTLYERSTAANALAKKKKGISTMEPVSVSD